MSAVTSIPEANSTIVFTGADGSYSLAGLATGTYKVTFDPDCGGGDGFTGQQVTVHTTAGTTLTGVNAALPAKS